MYHCHVQFYLLTHREEELQAISTIPPLEAFTHDFSVSRDLQPDLLDRADVILADLRDRDGTGTLAALTAGMRADAQLILLAEREQTEELGAVPDQVWDIWRVPMTRQELGFRFSRWQQAYKRLKVFGGNHRSYPQPDLV